MDIIWDGIGRAGALTAQAIQGRNQLADAARNHQWEEVFEILCHEPQWVNCTRPGGKSWYAPLHQAAHGGAPAGIVQRLIEMGAWRTHQNAYGERPIDIALRRGHRHLLAVLMPAPVRHVPTGILLRMQRHFHDVIHGRVSDLVHENDLRLPDLEPLLELREPKMWFAVPGMYAGFSYCMERDGIDATLVAESWCRVSGGSEQRHEITSRGSRLVEEGFV